MSVKIAGTNGEVELITPDSITGSRVIDLEGVSNIEDKGKNLCTAWVGFTEDTPPTIRSSFNISSVDTVSDTEFTLNFTESMVNNDYVGTLPLSDKTKTSCVVTTDRTKIDVIIFGGKS